MICHHLKEQLKFSLEQSAHSTRGSGAPMYTIYFQYPCFPFDMYIT